MDAAKLTSDILLRGYAMGVFPMAHSREASDVYWVDPRHRGVLPLERFHISRSLTRRLKRQAFEITVDRDFEGVLEGCANRPETWINDTIARLYASLHLRDFAHSLEVREGGELIGGVYGVALGSAFFGESMFSRRTDASKIALAYLVELLRRGGFQLFDTQFVTPHLISLGAEEISRRDYQRRLRKALAQPALFPKTPAPTPQELLQRMTHTS